jgi:hypothetical protein
MEKSFSLSLFPALEVTENGLFTASGTAVSLTSDNMESMSKKLIGYYYYRPSTGDARQFSGAFFDNVNNCWITVWHKVTIITPTANSTVRGLWYGTVAGKDNIFVACNGKLWMADQDNENISRTCLGDISTTSNVFFFGFSGKLYMLNGSEYKCYDGTNLYDVEGYRPLVTVGVQPTGGGTDLEQANKLNAHRRCWVSPDGSAVTIQLPETDLLSVDWVKDRASDTALTAYTVDLAAGTVTFSTAPAEGTNSLEIAWTAKTDFRSEITAMRFAELYNGTTDNRVFLYGDGSNTALYSGIDYDGNPTAEYFPDMNEIAIGDANTPITSLIRHYSRLIAFKTHSTYSIQYSSLTLADSSITAAFYATPINRSIGNEAPGQVQLCLNDPITLHGQDIYQWKNNSTYSNNLTVDERQARRISDRIAATFSSFQPDQCVCYDHNYTQELYIVCRSTAVVWNYAANVWYSYTDFPATALTAVGSELYYGTEDGYLRHVSNNYRNDNGAAIYAYWRSGSMAFNTEWLKKYTLRIYLGTKPDKKSQVTMFVNSDRTSDIGHEDVTIVTGNTISFADADFSDFGFSTSYVPHISRHKLKARKYAYCQLCLVSNSAEKTATITSVDIAVRDTVYAK